MSTRYRLTFAHGALAPGKDTFASMTAANLFGLYCPVKWGKFAVELVNETDFPAPTEALGVAPAGCSD